MGTHQPHNMNFYGTATVGAKGQIVIPAKAREELGIKTGDMLVIIGHKDRPMLGVCPVESVEAMLAAATQHLDSLRAAIDQSKQQDKKGN